jgi:hydroxyethylthiazole kinase-like uncharacterized protein yjeF
MEHQAMTIEKLPLYQVEQIRLCEQLATTGLGLSENELMERAGQAAFASVIKLFPHSKNLVIFCGAGNNAGDGYVLARLAREQGYGVIINQYKTAEHLPSAARCAALGALAAGVSCRSLNAPIDNNIDLIIDALLGIGVQGPVKEPIAAAIKQINDSQIPVLALDIPSGLNANTGVAVGICVRADVTITFIAPKLGLYTADGSDYCGQVVSNSLQLDNCLATLSSAAYLLAEQRDAILPKRSKNSHKGEFGHVLIIGGGRGMPGSVYLAAKAALRVGAGLVTIATRPEHAGQVLPSLPEAMIYGVDQAEELTPLIARANICIVGPGLGVDEWAVALYRKALSSQLPLIIDASGLHLLAADHKYHGNWVLTPHPGEAAKLLNCSTTEVQKDRYQAILSLQSQYGGHIILKGAGSLICTDIREIYLCSAGNPGMASAGMGDTLNGVIAGLFAQGLSLAEAAKQGVWVHAKAGDAAAFSGERGLLASDLMPYFRKQVNEGNCIEDS